MSPLEWGIYFNLGLVYLHLKVYSVAFHYFLTSIKYNPQNSEAYTLLGVCLNRLDDPANAFNAYEKACTIDSKNHIVYLNFAIFLAEHSRDPTNLQLAKEKYNIHNELYKQQQTRNPQVETQRAILRNMLRLE